MKIHENHSKMLKYKLEEVVNGGRYVHLFVEIRKRRRRERKVRREKRKSSHFKMKWVPQPFAQFF